MFSGATIGISKVKNAPQAKILTKNPKDLVLPPGAGGSMRGSILADLREWGGTISNFIFRALPPGAGGSKIGTPPQGGGEWGGVSPPF